MVNIKQFTKFSESGLVESLIVTVIFFSPNFLFLFYYVQWISFIYQFLLILLLVIVIIHFRYDVKRFSGSAKIDTLIDKKKDDLHKLYKDNRLQ